MAQVFQKFTKRYVTGKGVLIALGVVSSILFSSGCMSSNPRNPTTNPDRSAPTSAFTSPTAGGTVLAGVANAITGTASDTGGGSVARVEVSVDGGASFSAATGTTSWSFSFTPTTTGQATITSRAVDTSGNVQNPTTQITVTVIRDTTPPTSTITFPKAGGDISTGTSVSVTGAASDTGGGAVARVEVSVNGGAFSTATGTTSWSLSFTPTASGRVTIRSRAFDNSGNIQNPPTQITVNVVVGGTWTAMGPGPAVNGQVDNVTPNNEVVGAIHAVAAHPTDANILYVGGVNSGIWRTGNATAESPNWTPLTDSFPSLSIGALEFDPTDPTRRTLVAGIGRFSSFGRSGGPLTGLLRTTDGGDNWAQISHPVVANQNISGVAARGSTLLASGNATFAGINGGLFRSVDGGVTWVTVSGSGGLPIGAIFDLVGVPGNLNRFYVTVQRIGIFRSDDGGANWTNISSGDPALNAAITNAQNANAEMAVASNGRLYVIIANGSTAFMGARAQYIGFTDNPAAGAPWTAMDLPRTPESNGEIEGLHPGGQGSIHLSIAVDRNDPNTVYVAGDRQDNPFPNFIGANSFSGRLFRGDTSVAPTGAAPSPQWEHMTHSNSIAGISGGGTARGSSPHADSREMAIAVNGDLIEVNDGGIYRRTSPQNNTGDWFSMNGNIQTTEFHDVAYDSNSNAILLGGSQDNGTSQQINMGSTTWNLVFGGDGGDVAVDNITLAALNQSIRYFSSQNLGGFRRQVYDANNLRVGNSIPLVVINSTDAQFVTPVELNAIDPRRLVIGGSNTVFESFDQGSTVTIINGPRANAMAYGGRSGGVDNQEVLYVGSGGAIIPPNTTPEPPQVFVRTTAGAPLALTAPLPAGAAIVRDVVMDPDDWRSAYVVDSNRVFRTTNAGASWTDITGNLMQLGAGGFRTAVFVAGGATDMLVVGTNMGVFVSFSSSGFTNWNKLGTGLPNALVADLDYDAVDDVLLAGTLGRGAWTITNLRGLTPPRAEP
jgi:hypothetical protein